MIGSFWNLCRACPSMPVDKLHSEYRSTYRWHEFTGNSRPEIVRRPPIPNQTSFGPINEPPLPRRKKCPELAYKSHEFIIGSELRSDSRNDVIVNRARSEERGTTPSRRSKSEGPPAVPNGRAHPIASEIGGAGMGNSTVQAGESSGLFKKTISKLSTEYRIQFVWPNVRKSIKGKTNIGVELPKKSQSMGAIKSSQTSAMPTVHKKRTTNQKEATLHELEPLVNNVEERKPAEKLVTIVEKKSTRPFSQTFDHDRNNHFLTKRENFGFEKEKSAVIEDVTDNKNAVVVNGNTNEQWYRDVIELRKKAGEYKSRGWGMEIHPELYKKQKDLWDQVSKRSSLSALSLATSVHRPITKEEKEQENNKKSIPIKSLSKPRVPGQAHLIDNKDETILPSRFNTVRHHLERTTGPDVEEGALLPSPTREKLMPAITKRESESQRGSPKKSATSRHGSPQKGSPQKGSPKKTIKARSQSVGPGFENESPKRQMRSASTAPAATKTGKKTPVSTPTTANAISVDRKPRPSTLSTSIHSRLKSSSLPPSGRAHSVPANHHHIQLSQNDTNKTSQAILNLNRKNTNTTNNKTSKQTRPKSTANNRLGLNLNIKKNTVNKQIFAKGQDNKLAEYDGEEKDSSCSPQVPEVSEPIVKSPPEPTRVKSPEQIIMRSPDPVNWTVPLDTGKTFTVTQNVKEGLFLGETYSRPQSEIKASTPVDKPPPAPQSAPPELTQQIKMDAWKNSDHSDPKSSLLNSPTGGNIKINTFGPQSQQQSHRYDKPVPGTTIRCLDDPSFNSDTLTTIPSVNTARNTATDVLEKARDRFDRFWGGNKEDNV